MIPRTARAPALLAVGLGPAVPAVGASASSPTVERAATPAKSAFRPDIEGLRAVAVLLVVAFHAGLALVPGGFVGVDVFFVISGFLITGVLLDDWGRSGTVSISRFYARRARRLLPLAGLVLLATAVTTYFVIPDLNRPLVADDIRAAALWFANWDFAGSATQYMSDVDKSPVLHFWSLSVEEQFYVVWPLLILLVVRRRGGRRSASEVRHRLLVALAVLGTASFLLSGLTTSRSGPWAYFGLHTRAWELAAGACLAVARPFLPRLTARGAALGGGVGLTLVAWAVLAFDRTTTFPGWAAALPVLGTVLLLGTGEGHVTPVTRLLSTGPMTYVGRISYAWYLWHWPCLVFAGELTRAHGDDVDLVQTAAAPGLVAVLVAVVLSFGLSAVSHVLVERPVRSSPRLSRSTAGSLAMGAALVAVALVAPPALGLTGGGASTAPVVAMGAGAQAPGLGKGAVVRTPMSPAQARKEVDTVPGCFVMFTERTAQPDCRFGDPHGSKVVVLVGDSHAAHWFPTMDLVAKQQGWQLYFWTKAACAFADVTVYTAQYNREYDECTDWRSSVLDRIAALPRVDAVVIGRSYGYRTILMDHGKRVSAHAAPALWADGTARTFARLAADTRDVIVMRDTPRPGDDVPTCLSAHPGEPMRCAFPRAGHVHLDAPLYEAERGAHLEGARLHYVDLSAAVCPLDPCSVVAPSGAIIFRDRHHLTITFAKQLAPALTRALLAWVPSGS